LLHVVAIWQEILIINIKRQQQTEALENPLKDKTGQVLVLKLLQKEQQLLDSMWKRASKG
jgi:hypothetical protein